MKAIIEALNAVSETVWAIIIIVIGAVLGLVALYDHSNAAGLGSLATTIVGIGAMAFKGHNAQN